MSLFLTKKDEAKQSSQKNVKKQCNTPNILQDLLLLKISKQWVDTVKCLGEKK